VSGAPDLLLGVEGSGVKTQAVGRDLRGSILGRGLGASSNQHRVGIRRLAKRCTSPSKRRRRRPRRAPEAIFPPGRPHRRSMPRLSGVDQPSDQTLITQWLGNRG